MDPHKQQTIDYINQQKRQGFTEDAIRQSLVASGWVGPAIDEVLRLSGPASSINPAFAQFIPTQEELNPSSNKSFSVAWIVSLLVGSLGIDRFYLGFTKLGILKLLTLGGFGVWYIIDFIRLGFGKQRDVRGKPLQATSGNSGIFKVLTIVFSIMIITSVVVVGALMLNTSNTQKATSGDESASDDTAPAPGEEARDDVLAIYTAFQGFKDDHNGASPKSFVAESDTVLKMCGESCDASQSASVTLSHINPESVLLEQYTDDIELLEDTGAYVVLGARCNESSDNDGPLLTRDDGAGSVLLFATEDTELEAVIPQCVSFN
jgi:TM2 domain-containing membrane protein YozV